MTKSNECIPAVWSGWSWSWTFLPRPTFPRVHLWGHLHSFTHSFIPCLLNVYLCPQPEKQWWISPKTAMFSRSFILGEETDNNKNKYMDKINEEDDKCYLRNKTGKSERVTVPSSRGLHLPHHLCWTQSSFVCFFKLQFLLTCLSWQLGPTGQWEGKRGHRGVKIFVEMSLPAVIIAVTLSESFTVHSHTLRNVLSQKKKGKEKIFPSWVLMLCLSMDSFCPTVNFNIERKFSHM